MYTLDHGHHQSLCKVSKTINCLMICNTNIYQEFQGTRNSSNGYVATAMQLNAKAGYCPLETISQFLVLHRDTYCIISQIFSDAKYGRMVLKCANFWNEIAIEVKQK